MWRSDRVMPKSYYLEVMTEGRKFSDHWDFEISINTHNKYSCEYNLCSKVHADIKDECACECVGLYKHSQIQGLESTILH